jgi:hypothetical protein
LFYLLGLSWIIPYEVLMSLNQTSPAMIVLSRDSAFYLSIVAWTRALSPAEILDLYLVIVSFPSAAPLAVILPGSTLAF